MLDQHRLKELLHYDPEIGIFTWLKNRRHVKVGTACSYIGNNGYINIKVDQQKFVAQKLAWLWMTGDLPPSGMDIDHINMIKTDNRFCNLRLATRSQNKGNTALRPDNTSGYKGVSFHKASGKWRASICKDGKQCQLGVFLTPESARDAYVLAATELFGEFSRPASRDCQKKSEDRPASSP